MGDALDRLTAARFDGPQALYTEAVRLLSERPALPDDLAGLVARLRDNGHSLTQRERSKAADAIEALAAENARLAAKVEKLRGVLTVWGDNDERDAAEMLEHRFENCTIDLRGAGYRAAIRTSHAGLETLYGTYQDGGMVMVDGDKITMVNLHILGPDAVADIRAEAHATGMREAARICRADDFAGPPEDGCGKWASDVILAAIPEVRK